MDPATAFALAVKALAELATEMMRGQTIDQKQQLWKWYLDDVKALRTLLGLKTDA